eukprot:jgi/Tetstr1/458761/TSEL_045146.t2
MGPRSSRDDPNFMETFYKASRLHFIGTWKARNEALVDTLCRAGPQPSAPPPPGADPLAGAAPLERAIIHLDMDAFFATVACLTHPSLRDKPLAVSHSNSNAGTSGGEISSANYPARALGIRAGMWMGEAKKLCPDLLVMPYQFERYQEISDKVYSILLKYTAAVQPISCDEAFLDVTGLGDPTRMAADIRQEIEEQTGCTASAGIGPNMLLARLATKKAKPDGQFALSAADARAYVAQLPVGDLPGVGWKLRKKLTALGIATCADVLACGRDLRAELGDKTGAQLREFAAGRDDRQVEPPRARKSVGAEVNWGVRFQTTKEAEDFLEGLAGEVAARLEAAGAAGRSLTLKLKRRSADAPEEPRKFLGHGLCDNMSKSCMLPRLTGDAQEIARSAKQLLRQLACPPDQVRGIGLSMTRLQGRSGAPRGANAPPLERFFQHHKAASAEDDTAGGGDGPGRVAEVHGETRQFLGRGGDSPGASAREPSEPGTPDASVDAGGGVAGAGQPAPRVAGPSARDGISAAVLAALPPEMRQQLRSPRSDQQGAPLSPAAGAGTESASPSGRSCGAPGASVSPAGQLGGGAGGSNAGPFAALPPPSQLDPSVLRELPPDIRREIQLAYAQDPARAPHRTMPPQPSRPHAPESAATWRADPGPSGAGRGVAMPAAADPLGMRSHGLGAGSSGHQPADINITMSQVDPECMAALPAEIQAELKAQLRHSRRAAAASRRPQRGAPPQRPAQPRPGHAPAQLRGSGPDAAPPSTDRTVRAVLQELLADMAEACPPEAEPLRASLAAMADELFPAGADATVPEGWDSDLPPPPSAPPGDADPGRAGESGRWGSCAQRVGALIVAWGSPRLATRADEVRGALMAVKRLGARFPDTFEHIAQRTIDALQLRAVGVFGGTLRLRSLFDSPARG